MVKKKIEIIIVWHGYGPDPNHFCTLVYRGPNARVRVYNKDEYDGRCGDDLPYFDDWAKGSAYCLANPDKKIQLELGVAKRVGLA